MSSARDCLFAGHAAFVDEDYVTAEGHYSEAIALAESTCLADCFAKRSAVQLKLGKRTAAVEDASRSIEMHPTAPAYMRKGTAYFALEEFESARVAFQAALQLEPSQSKLLELKRWVRKCGAEISGEGNAFAPSPNAAQNPAAPAPPATTSAPRTNVAQNIRHEWYREPPSQCVLLEGHRRLFNCLECAPRRRGLALSSL